MAVRFSILVCLLGGVMASCSGARSYLNPDADMGYYQRVGVAAFVSLTDDLRAGQKIQRVFMTEMLKRKDFDIVPAGQFEKLEADARSKNQLTFPAPLDSAALKMIGAQSGAQAIITGVVRDYRMERVGQDEFPLIALSIQMVDVATGRVIWDVSVGERGGPKFPVLSFGETHTLSELSEKLCRRALGTL